MHSDNRTPFNNEDPKTGLDGGLSEGFYHSLARFRPTVSVLLTLMDILRNCL